MNHAANDWWNRWPVAGVCILAAMIPLLPWPIPPLVDVPGHMGRYAVQLDPEPFKAWYSFRWQLIGNLGVDLLMELLGRLFGLELAVKLIVMTIPALTVAGFLAVARVVHGHLPPTAFFALPFAYGHPFIYGFVNFSLAMALALLGFALWLHLGRRGMLMLRGVVFVPLAFLIWTAHTYGWGFLGLLCFSAEVVRLRSLNKSWAVALLTASLFCVPLSLPLVPILIWRSGSSFFANGVFDWKAKIIWMATALRDRWMIFDVGSLLVTGTIIVFAVFSKMFSFSKFLQLPVLALVGAYIFLPYEVFGSGYADMRLAPYIFAMLLIALHAKPNLSASKKRISSIIAILGMTLFASRIAAHTVSFGITSERYHRALGALPYIPKGSRVVSFTAASCYAKWSKSRLEHLSAIAMVRRDAFSNDQWKISGANLLETIKADSPGFENDPSQFVVAAPCPNLVPWRSLDQALYTLPRRAFDYVWLIDPPRYDVRMAREMTEVWSNGTDRLYRIDKQ